MQAVKNFLKGIVAGIGGAVPGLSGSVLMVIMGLYDSVIGALGSLFKNFWKKVLFLLPIVLGMGCGIVGFNWLVKLLLTHFETLTRFAFLGLVLGTVPLFFKQVRKKGFRNRYYIVMLVSGLAGFLLLGVNTPQIGDPNFLQKMLLGAVWAGSSIVPGVDNAVILTALGLYNSYLDITTNLNILNLLPVALGLVLGAAGISAIMNFLLKKAYTLTYSVVFGLFVSIIPSVLEDCYKIHNLWEGVVAISFAVAGFFVSYYLGDISGNNARIKRLFKKK